jgi:hypothetical protein
MVLIWRGLGILIPVIYGLSYLAVSYVIATFDLDVDIDIANSKFLWCWALVGGVLTWFFGKDLNSPKTDEAGNPVRKRHDLFFIPVQYWAFVVAGFVLFLQLTALKRFDYERKIYAESRASFVNKKTRLLEHLENPKHGDFYFFELDNSDWDGSAKGDQPFRNYRGIVLKLVDFDESRLLFQYPNQEDGKRIYPTQDVAAHFQDSLPSRKVWLRKQSVKGAIATNFHKSRSFSGTAIEEFGATGKISARLEEIKRD